MKPAAVALIGLAAFAAFTALAHQQATAANDLAAQDSPPAAPDGWWPAGSSDLASSAAEPAVDVDVAIEAPSSWNSVDLWGMTAAAIESRSVSSAVTAQDARAENVRAFLSMIATSEGTDRAADPYRVCYGYRHTIQDLIDHPAVTGEWMGESIANLGPKYSGMKSTAAGRYQIIKPTWVRCRNALRLADFSAASQDAAAVYLIKTRRALDAVQAGRIEEAISLCRDEWASLPGGSSGQPQQRLASLLESFTTAGGYLA